MIKLIWSPDDLLADEAAEELVAGIGADGEVLTLDADAGLDGLEEALFATSLFASSRAVVLRNLQTLKKADVERLSAVLHRGSLAADLVMTAVSERVPAPLIDAVKDAAEVVRLSRPRRGELAAWVTKRMKQSGLAPGRDAALTLVESVGESLRDLDQAILQLSLRAGKDGRIETADVLQHFSRTAEQPIWVLFDAIVRHEGTKAFDALRRLFAHGDEPLPVLGAIVSQVRGVIRAKALVERSVQDAPHDAPTKGPRDGDLAKTLGVSEGRAAVLRRQSSRLSWEWLLAVHRLCAQADYELKGGEDGAVLPPEMVLERLVVGALEAN